MKVTLRDIAARTGFSVNTVSHALAGKTDISSATRAEITRVAQEMGYIRNRTASGLRSGNTDTVALILPDIANPNFTMMMRGIEAFFRERGYTVFVVNTDEDVAIEAAAITAVLEQNVGGIVLCPVAGDAKNLQNLKKSGVPFALIGRHCPEIDTDYVVCDDEEGGYLAAAHLLENGHRHIAFFNGDCRISSARARLCGIRRAMREAGTALPSSCVLALSVKTGERNRDTMRTFFAQHSEVTALVAFSDLLAFEAASVLSECGKSVPQDISIVGFDNICADFVFPMALSSVSVRKETMATAAAELLWQTMCGEQASEHHIVLPTALVARNTVKKLT